MVYQLLCMCYNSSESIYEVLSSWVKDPLINSVHLLINGGPNNDYSDIIKTLKQIKKLNYLDINITVCPFIGFSETRNKLIESVSPNVYSIFIDDSYILKSPLSAPRDYYSPIQMIKIYSGNTFYYSNRFFKNGPKYIGKIHETIDTNLRVISEIEVTDKIYNTHIERTNLRKPMDLELLKDDKSQKGLYYKMVTLASLFSLGQTTRKEVEDASKEYFLSSC